MKIIKVETTSSTNSWISQNIENLEFPSMVYTPNQTAGRGQRGNSWESEPGMNLTASFLLRVDKLEASRQFVISEAVALSTVDFLKSEGIQPKIKWPNDIYVGDKKIAGILIEHSLTGSVINRTIAGIGVNLNQTKFKSDAPNPVSLKMLTGKTSDIDRAAEKFASFIENRLGNVWKADAIHKEFMEVLWRNDGNNYPFHDRKEDKLFKGRITGVAPDGMLTLITEEGNSKEFAFKEVEFIL